MSNNSQSNYEPGYRSVLIREETKQKLREFRKTLPERDFNQERRLATAAIEYCLRDATARKAFLALVSEIVRMDLETTRPRDDET